jgi:hypothetical protein
LLISFYLFARAAFESVSVAWYGLLCMLFLWGPAPMMLSGFLHLTALAQTAPYPSTFVSALTFFVWYLVIVLRNRPRLLAFALIPLISFALLSHPLTSIGLLTGLIALVAGDTYPVTSRIAVLAAAGAAFAAACFWPLYPLLGQLHESPGWSLDSRFLYSISPTLLFQALPVVLALPLLYQRLRRDRRDFVALTFIGLLFVYIYGGITGKYVYGRVLAFLILTSQLAVADWLSKRAEATPSGRGMIYRRATLGLVAFCAVMTLPGIAICLPLWQDSYSDLRFLSTYLSPADTVLADAETSLKEPSFGGRLVAFNPVHRLSFVPDIDSRNADRAQFLDAGVSDEIRQKILEKYRVRYVLINRREVADWPRVLQATEHFGTIRYWDGDMILVSIPVPAS